MRSATCDLTVIGRDEHGRPRTDRVDEVADQAVGGAELGLVVRTEPALVGDLVDAAVVAVHEALPRRHEFGGLDRDRAGARASREASSRADGLRRTPNSAVRSG